MRTLCAGLAFLGLLAACTRLLAADYAYSLDKMAELILAEEQETRLRDIRQEFSAKIAKAGKDLAALAKEEVTEIRTVLTPAQNKRVEALKLEPLDHKVEGLAQRLAGLAILDLTQAELAKIREVREQYRPKIEKALKNLDTVLGREQTKARTDAINSGKTASQVMADLKLTDTQKEAVAAIGKTLSSLVKEELEKLKGILDQDQKVLLLTLEGEGVDHVRDQLAHRIANIKELKLTDQQKKAISRIRNDYRPKVREAGNNLRALIRQEMTMIAAVLKG
jgi:Spy/CpxP family protein refolding chaperone